MRLLLINYEYPPIGGGAGNATAYMARALAVLGHRPIVLTAAYGSQPAQSLVEGVTVIRVSARRKRPERSSVVEMAAYVVAASFALPRVLRTQKPDAAIVFFSMPCGPLGLLTHWWRRIPYVVSLRGGDVPGTESSLRLVYWLLKPMRRLVMRTAAAVVANSDGLKSLSEAADPVPVEVIPNGVDTDFFRPGDKQDERAFTFLFVGRFQPQKNLPFLLEAVATLRREASLPFRVVLVGGGVIRPALQRQCTAWALDEVVTWYDWCSKEQLRGYYQAADCFVNPSLYEGMPNAVLEAMACGLPIVASAVAGNDELVLPEQTGFLFRLGDVAQCVAIMSRLLADPCMARRLGAAGRRHVMTTYSWQHVAQRYLGLLTVTGVS